MHKHLQRDSNQRRKEKYAGIICQMEKAAKQHDSQTTFKLIQRLAPKTRFRRLCLRGPDNDLLTRQAELAEYRAYCEKLYGSDLPPLSVPASSHPPVLDTNLLMWALQALHPSKAVLQRCAPAVMWKAHSDILAPVLSQLCKELWTPGCPKYLSLWADACVKWVGKPAKTVKSPETLRRIAVQRGRW